MLSDASKLLKGAELVTLAQMNCDVHRQLCDLAGIASLCTFTVYNEDTMCPNQLGGHRSGGGSFVAQYSSAEDIRNAMLVATGKKGAPNQQKVVVADDANDDWGDDDEVDGDMQQASELDDAHRNQAAFDDEL